MGCNWGSLNVVGRLNLDGLDGHSLDGRGGLYSKGCGLDSGNSHWSSNMGVVGLLGVLLTVVGLLGVLLALFSL